MALPGLVGDGLGLLLALGRAVRVHLVGVVGGGGLVVLVGGFIVVVEQAAFDLDAVRGFEVGGEVEAVDVETVGLPELVLDRVGDPDAERLVSLLTRWKVSIVGPSTSRRSSRSIPLRFG